MAKKANKGTYAEPLLDFEPPEYVNILGVMWHTHLSEGLSNQKEGEIDSEKRVLRIHKDMRGDIGDVWFHELGHAIMHSSGFNEAITLVMKAAGMDSDQTDKIVEGVDELVQEIYGRVLYDTLRRNKINFGDPK